MELNDFVCAGLPKKRKKIQNNLKEHFQAINTSISHWWMFLFCVCSCARSSAHHFTSYILFYVVIDAHWCCQFECFRKEDDKNVSLFYRMFVNDIISRGAQCFVHFCHVFMTFISILFIFLSLSPALIFLYLFHYFRSSVYFFSQSYSFVRILKNSPKTRTHTANQRPNDTRSVSCCVERIKLPLCETNGKKEEKEKKEVHNQH